VSLYKKKDIEVPVSAISDGHINWETSATKITINTGITAYDDEILDESGELLEMAVEGSAFNSSVNKIYVQYRALLQTYADSVYTMEDIGDVASTLGTIDSDNPLALGVFLAMTNANGTPVKYMAVPTDNLAGYSAVVDKLYERSDVYGLVPLSKDNAVQTLFAGHAANMSSAEKAKWRIAFLNSDATEEVALVSSTVAAETTITFTAEDGEYVIVDWVDNVPTNGGFLTSGVDDGDIIRTNYEPDGTYSEYIVDNVITETQLRLMAGPAVISDAPVKFEAWHTNSKNETAAAYALKSGSFGSRRVYHIWPDKIDYGTQLIEGYYLACAIAGLVSGVVPQQGLTNLEITGFTAVTRTGSYFNTAQLDVMAEGGTFIVTQDPTTGAIYTRHQLSTDTTDLNSKELSVVKNVDSISYVFSRELAPYIGVANVTPALLDKLKALVLGTINYLVGNGYVARIGGQLISAEITELRQHAVLKDRVKITLDIKIPYPLNNIELHLVV
jgi:hypothetical protein